MDGLGLLVEARAAGLTVSADGDRLVIEGPRDAGAVAARLLADKVAVLAALATRRAYPPLAAVIAADVATKHTRAEITARLQRLTARAALPGATALDIAVAADWREILQAKQGDRR